MKTGIELCAAYRKAIEKFNEPYSLCIITNPNAKKDGILLVGMNPSGNNPNDEASVDYNNCRKKEKGKEYSGDPSSFWGPKHEMMGKYDKYVNYIDLLPIRSTIQNDVDKMDNKYRARLLEITQQHIEEIRPKLIILANSSALYYWGSNPDAVWMGYKLGEPIKLLKGKWALYKIIGLRKEEKELINQEYFAQLNYRTNLEGSYLLSYCQVSKRHKYPKPEEIIKESDIESLLKEIDPIKERDLY